MGWCGFCWDSFRVALPAIICKLHRDSKDSPSRRFAVAETLQLHSSGCQHHHRLRTKLALVAKRHAIGHERRARTNNGVSEGALGVAKQPEWKRLHVPTFRLSLFGHSGLLNSNEFL